MTTPVRAPGEARWEQRRKRSPRLSHLWNLTNSRDSNTRLPDAKADSTVSNSECAVNGGERRLVALAAALLGDTCSLSRPEARLLAAVRPAQGSNVAEMRRSILAGNDPLGETLCRVRSASQRRECGAVYTPPAIVTAMMAWARTQTCAPARVVDPGAGSGRFLIEAGRTYSNAGLVAVEIDPVAALLVRANAFVHGLADRLTVHLEDYRDLVLPDVSGPTLYIGNPPYVRHHRIDRKWKDWFAATARRYGVNASKLAGLHIHFFFKTRELARPGDYGAFITAAEWLDVNYGDALRRLLADGLGGTAVHVIRPEAQPFEDALTTGAITCFRVGGNAREIAVRSVRSLGELAPLGGGRAVDFRDAAGAPKWSVFLRENSEKRAGFIELGELFRVHRGQVTGGNSIWIDSSASLDLPVRYKPFAVTKARELIAAGAELATNRGLQRVIDLPADLDTLDRADVLVVRRFLAWAKANGAHASYVASHRRAWWSVGLREPAPILCTYMARRPAVFVRNLACARHINIAHGLYPREPVDERTLRAVLAWLRQQVSVADGRTYAGGLVKFEPREVERILLPQPGDIHAYLTERESSPETLVPHGAADRRGRREGDLSPRAPA